MATDLVIWLFWGLAALCLLLAGAVMWIEEHEPGHDAHSYGKE
jgi:hypothetical protein